MEHHEQHGDMHTVGYGTYILVWLGLVVFTGLTVGAAFVDLASMTVPVALAIATVKTSLVVYFFMHIKYESSLFKIFLVICFVFLVISFVLTFFDFGFRPVPEDEESANKAQVSSVQLPASVSGSPLTGIALK